MKIKHSLSIFVGFKKGKAIAVLYRLLKFFFLNIVWVSVRMEDINNENRAVRLI